MGSSYLLQTQNIDEGKLEMVLHVDVHFAGFKPGNVIEIYYATPASDNSEAEWFTNNGEFHAANDVRTALMAFDYRVHKGGWDISDLGKNLDDLLTKA